MRLGVICLLFLVGCSSVDPAVGGPSELSGSVGVLHVERSEVEGSGRTVLRAAFARYQGIDGDSVVRLLGSGAAAELGSCEVVDPSEVIADENADVELLDVGALHVSVADTEARLSPRTFPDLASVLAGVFYAGDAPLAMPRPEVDEYRFEAEGGVEVGAFEVVVPAPAELSNVTLAGADGTSAALDGRLAEITRAGSLTLQWDSEDPRDYVEIELAAGDKTLACLGRDDGSFRIVASDVARLTSDGQARLVVRRVRVSPFDAPGIETAFARVAAARSFPLSVR
jgi:hypothetical protein